MQWAGLAHDTVRDYAATLNLYTVIPFALATIVVNSWREHRYFPTPRSLLLFGLFWLLFAAVLQPFATRVRKFDNLRDKRQREYEESCVLHPRPETSPLGDTRKPDCVKTELDIQASSYALAFAELIEETANDVITFFSNLAVKVIAALTLVCVALIALLCCSCQVQQFRSMGATRRKLDALSKLATLGTHGPPVASEA